PLSVVRGSLPRSDQPSGNQPGHSQTETRQGPFGGGWAEDINGPQATDHGHAAPIVSVENLVDRIDVYDLSIEEASEFCANGILVDNCDELAAFHYPAAWDNLMFGLRLGANPRICVTTTPKPVRLVKALVADPTTAIVRGSTHENRLNLAPAFFEK